LNKGLYAKFKVGDSFCFTFFEKKQWVAITERKVFKDVKSALQQYDLSIVLPNCKTINEAITIYNSFPGYEKHLSRQRQDNLVALRFTLISDPRVIPTEQKR
jgi:ASC-1-like (ASCH) protein